MSQKWDTTLIWVEFKDKFSNFLGCPIVFEFTVNLGDYQKSRKGGNLFGICFLFFFLQVSSREKKHREAQHILIMYDKL